VALQQDGKVLVSGDFTMPRKYVARLNSDGSLDTTFEAEPQLGVFAIAVQPDGRIWIGGDFREVNDEVSPAVARLYGDPVFAPVITLQPGDAESHPGCCVTFTAAADGAPRDYRWRKDGIELANGDGISGADSAVLHLTNVDALDAGDYSLRASSSLGDAISSDATLTLVAAPSCRMPSCGPGGCELILAPDGSACNDADKCTSGDECTAGECGGTSATPGEASGVRVARAGVSADLTWTAAPESTSSAVLRGLGETLPVGPGGGDEACLATSLPAGAESWSDADPVGSGSFYWYLVRSDNACGQGSYGSEGVGGTVGPARTSSTCP
jgi:hypothetical protein